MGNNPGNNFDENIAEEDNFDVVELANDLIENPDDDPADDILDDIEEEI